MTFTSDSLADDDNRPSDKPTVPPDWSRIALERIPLTRDPNGGYRCKMPGPYWVTEATLRHAWKLFWRSAHSLDASASHTARDLACISDWGNRPRGQRIAIGRCFKYFSVNCVLPITLVNPEAKYNFKYRLNGPLDQPPPTQ